MIVIARVAVALFWMIGLALVFVSATWMVNVNVPAVLALPEITPAEVNFRPGGSFEPDTTDHLSVDCLRLPRRSPSMRPCCSCCRRSHSEVTMS